MHVRVHSVWNDRTSYVFLQHCVPHQTPFLMLIDVTSQDTPHMTMSVDMAPAVIDMEKAACLTLMKLAGTRGMERGGFQTSTRTTWRRSMGMA